MGLRQKLFWLCVAAVFVVGVASFIPGRYELCEIADKTKKVGCSTYQLVPFVGLSLGKVLDAISPALTAIFTVVLGISTIGLWRATQDLYLAGEKQLSLLDTTSTTQSRDMQDSIAASKAAARSAEAANMLALQAFMAEQRPWLLPTLVPIIELHSNGPNLTTTINGTIKNIGRSPAFKISYFGKLYTPTDKPAINAGMAYFDEHKAEPVVFAPASALPTETVPMSFGPYGVPLADLPKDGRFTLFLAMHIQYEMAIGDQRHRIAEFGAVYMVQPIGGGRADFSLIDVSSPTAAALVEFHGARRMT